jgi:diguanylate cyclase (GGDEF)-like protein
MSSMTLWIVTVAAASAAVVFAGVALRLSLRSKPARDEEPTAAPRSDTGATPAVEQPPSVDEAELRRLREVAAFTATLDLQELASRVLDTAILASGSEAGAIAVEAAEPAPPVIVARGLSEPELAWLSSPLRARNDSAIITRYLYDGRELGDERFATALLVPIRDGEGEPVGNLAALWRIDLAREADERLAALGEVVGVAAGGLTNALRFHEVSALSIRDTGTGLLDRRYFAGKLDAEVDRARRSGDRLALVLVMVDGLGAIESRRGAAEADAALARVAARLRQELVQPDEVCRLGRGELGLFVPGGESADLQGALNRLRQSLDEIAGDGSGKLGCSGAIAELRPGETTTSFYERAEAALRSARAVQTGGVVVAAA